ncbi:MAG TPA: hypothetical protein PL048_07620 [Leptospiraceae bacterium]|nr:hypothetical protein [Leptospiraceae bacterium]HMZ58628.1 hypothetical protein [Leptospiraceae bacterium]HNM05269.1 hypothetical protein [Leptospiraceae bacterium]
MKLFMKTSILNNKLGSVRHQMRKELIYAGADISRKDKFGNNRSVGLVKFGKLYKAQEFPESINGSETGVRINEDADR